VITKRVLVDTGPLVALLREDDEHHDACVKQAKALRRPAYTCWPVLTEAAYLLRDRPTTVSALLSWSDGTDFEILTLDASDLPGITAVLEKYRDQRIQLADAALMYLAEREAIDTIFTLDRRDFSIYRTASNKSLELLP
jgi:predicted nucleic acid-binding protein